MSVLIKGMEMPQSCSDCQLNYDQFACSVTGTRWWSDTMVSLGFDCDEERLQNCPLVKLPEHHGRLIDENEVRIVMNWLLTQPQRPTWNDTYNAIQEMNAVIEAEGAEE